MKYETNRKGQTQHLIKYFAVGIFDTILLYVVYAGLLLLGLHYLVASISGYLISTASAYYLNTKYVFVRKGEPPKYSLIILLRTFLTYGITGVLLHNVLLTMWIEVFHLSEFIAPILSLLINVPINYCLNRYWAFRVRKSLRDRIG